MTQADRDAYIADQGQTCPECGGEPEIISETPETRLKCCTDCCAQWQDDLAIVGFRMLTPERIEVLEVL